MSQDQIRIDYEEDRCGRVLTANRVTSDGQSSEMVILRKLCNLQHPLSSCFILKRIIVF